MEELTKRENRRIKFLGMRVVKTIIAVYICFLISLLTKTSPFYSAIAAILCMQNSPEDSYEVGKNRMIGTLIGGLYGFIAVLLVDFLNIEVFTHTHYLILCLFLIPLIYTNVMCESRDSTYISCVVFLSITVSHGGDASPLMFALSRVINTVIGIIVSIVINRAI